MMAADVSFDTLSAPSTPDEISNKVLRRAEIAKMSRALQDRLAYASYKNKMGMNRFSFDLVEAHVAAKSPKKKRRTETGSVVSSSSSSSSTTTTDENTFSLFPQSSPVSAPLFSDDLHPATEPRLRSSMHYTNPDDTPTIRTGRTKRKNMAPSLEGAFDVTKPEIWKPSTAATAHTNTTTTTFCDSSPIHQRLHPDFRTAAGPNLSFAADLSNSPTFGPLSPSEEPELPVHSFQRSGSPPRTPPPTRRKTHTNTHTSEGAQLLMHLASSPTPAPKGPHSLGPSTPPRNAGTTPNRMLDASPNLFNFGTPFGFNTPAAGAAFNLADFCNVTPSPAQAAFGSRTPLMNKTPSGLSSTRRALDFDSLMPPSPSPAKDKGLNLELGGKIGES